MRSERPVPPGFDLLAGGVAHDLNNVLASMRVVVARLRSEGPQPDGALLSYLDDAIDYSAALCRALVDHAQEGEQGDVVDVSALVARMAGLLRGRAPSAVALHLPGDTSSLPVRANAVHLQRVLVNLVENAFDAVAETGGEVRVRLASDGREAAHDVVLSVEDTGSGVPAALLGQLFRERRSTKGPGRGYGLLVVAALVERHGGTLHVASEEGRGTRIDVRLPRLSR